VVRRCGRKDRQPNIIASAIVTSIHYLGVAQPDALLLRARLRGALEPESPERIESDIDEAAAIIEGDELRAHEPDVHEARAALARLRGDEPGWQRELEQARDLARVMGADPRADCMAALLAWRKTTRAGDPYRPWSPRVAPMGRLGAATRGPHSTPAGVFAGNHTTVG